MQSARKGKNIRFILVQTKFSLLCQKLHAPQLVFTLSLSKRKQILIKWKHYESYLRVWYHPMTFSVTQTERSIIRHSLYFCSCLSKRTPYFIFFELFIHGLKIKLLSVLWSCVWRLQKSTTHQYYHIYMYINIYIYIYITIPKREPMHDT